LSLTNSFRLIEKGINWSYLLYSKYLAPSKKQRCFSQVKSKEEWWNMDEAVND